MSAVISAQGEIDLGKAVLDDLFDLFALREKAAGDARYLTAMPLEQLLERCFVAGAGRGHQRIVCWFFPWLHNLFSDGFAKAAGGPPIRAVAVMSFSN